VRYSREQLALFRLIPTELRFRESGGLQRLRLRYASPELAMLRRRLGADVSVQCFVDRLDLSYLVVLDPETRGLLRVECVEAPEVMRGLTEYQQRLVLAKCRERKRWNPSIKEQLEGRMEIVQDVLTLRDAKSMHKRKMAARVGSMPSVEGVESKPAVQEERVITELERQMMDLEEIADDMLTEDA
jgi:hypothetical protein